VLVGKDGTKIELRGAIPYDDYLPTAEATVKVKGVKSIVDSMLAGKATSDYKGELDLPNENDHIIFLNISSWTLMVFCIQQLTVHYCSQISIY
jgi:hypothetical protein